MLTKEEAQDIKDRIQTLRALPLEIVIDEYINRIIDNFTEKETEEKPNAN